MAFPVKYVLWNAAILNDLKDMFSANHEHTFCVFFQYHLL